MGGRERGREEGKKGGYKGREGTRRWREEGGR